jgi:hypothetical protein
MDFGEMFRVLRRQWVAATVGLLLTVVATVGAYLATPNKYQSVAQVTLVGSRALATQPGNGNNPYLTVGALNPMAGILATNLSSDQAVAQLKALGVTDPFTVEIPTLATGPFLAITVIGTNPAQIMRSMWVIINFSAQRLIQLQQNTPIPIPKKSLIQAQVMAQPNVPTPVLKKKIGIAAGVAVTCIILTLLLILGLENLRIRRAAKSMKRRSVMVTGKPQDIGQKAAPTSPEPTGTGLEPVTGAAAAPFPVPGVEASPGALQSAGSADGLSFGRSASPASDLGASAPYAYSRDASTWGTSLADGPGASAADGPDSGRSANAADEPGSRSVSPAGDAGSGRGSNFWDSGLAAGPGASASDEAGASEFDRRGASIWGTTPAGDAGSRSSSFWDSDSAAGRGASAADGEGNGRGAGAADGAGGGASDDRSARIWGVSRADGPSTSAPDGPDSGRSASAPDGPDSGRSTSAPDGPDSGRSTSAPDGPDSGRSASAPDGPGSRIASPAGDAGSSRGSSIWDSGLIKGRGASAADGEGNGRGAGAADGAGGGASDGRSARIWGTSRADGPGASAPDEPGSRIASPADDAGSGRGSSIWDSGLVTRRGASEVDGGDSGRSANAADGASTSAADGADSSRSGSAGDGRSASAADGASTGAADGADSGRSASPAEEFPDDDWRDQTVPSIPVIR